MAAPHARSGPDGPPGGGGDGGWPSFTRLTVPGFAWEFLRRNPDYRAEFARDEASGRAGEPRLDARWGLRFPVDPALPASHAEVFWREEVAPGLVVPMIADTAGQGRPARTPSALGRPRRGEDGLHVRLTAGLQLLFRGETRPDGPVLVVLSFDQDFGLRVRAVEALQRAAAGRGQPRSHLTPAQRTRLARSLAALDGAQRSDSYRDIARTIFGAEALEREDWRTASIRDVTIRLVRTGRALMRGGYLKLLRLGL